MKEEIVVDGDKYILKSSVKNKIQIKVPHGDKSIPFLKMGKIYFIRTVTHYYVGELIWVGEKEIALTKACWIADTGRFNEFLKDKSKANETEPYPENSVVCIGRGSIIDFTEYTPALILSVK